MSKNKIFPIIGMHCASCAKLIERKLAKTPGVTEASVNYASETASINYDPETVKEGDLAKAVEDAGYKAIILDKGKTESELKEKEKVKELSELKTKVFVSGLLSILIFLGSMKMLFTFVPHFLSNPVLLLLLPQSIGREE